MFVMIMIINFIFNFSNFCVIVCFLLISGILFSRVVIAVCLAKLPTSGILFSNSVNFVFLTRLLTSGILFSNSVLSVLYLVFNTKSLVSILFTFATNLSYTAFLQHHFLLRCLIYSNQQEQALICECLISQLQFSDQLNLFLM